MWPVLFLTASCKNRVILTKEGSRHQGAYVRRICDFPDPREMPSFSQRAVQTAGLACRLTEGEQALQSGGEWPPRVASVFSEDELPIVKSGDERASAATRRQQGVGHRRRWPAQPATATQRLPCAVPALAKDHALGVSVAGVRLRAP